MRCRITISHLVAFALGTAFLLTSACATDEIEDKGAGTGPGPELPTSTSTVVEDTLPPPILTPIYFPNNGSDIPQHHWRELFILAYYLKLHPKSRLEIEGHADMKGNMPHNKMLGRKRADAVKEMVVFFGAPIDQIFTISLGQNCPAMIAGTSFALQFNRRVELVLKLGIPKDGSEDPRESLLPARYSRSKCF